MGIRKEVKGAAAALALAGNISSGASSCTANGTVSGWPTGASYPFVIVIGKGTATEEKILCSSLVGSSPATINFTTRGYDGTTASAHSAADAVQHCVDADTLNTTFAHVFDTTADDHTQYMKVDGTRAFSSVTSLVGVPVSVGTGNAGGSASTFARSDHVHDIAEGAIDHAGLLAAGIVDFTKLSTGLLPVLSIADATGLAIMAALNITGLPVFQADVKRYLGWDGSAWKPIMSIASGEQKAQMFSTGITGGPTSSTTELTLGTLVIGAKPYGYKLDVAAFWSAHNAGGGGDSTYDFRIKVDGTEKAKITIRFFGGNIRLPLVIPTIDVVTIAASTACTVTCTAQRTSGTDNLTEDTAGKMTAKLFFD